MPALFTELGLVINGKIMFLPSKTPVFLIWGKLAVIIQNVNNIIYILTSPLKKQKRVIWHVTGEVLATGNLSEEVS